MTNADTERYRRELQAHCYRMLGSTHEAEDAVQDTLVRAWRALEHFEGRTSLRNWLYRIATNVSLSMLARRSAVGRVLPQLAAPAANGLPEGRQTSEFAWLEPYPDTALENVPDSAPGPHARIELREATQLAFVAAIQYLPPRQRATLLLRDVLGWSAAETAETLAASLASVNSALQRARETLRKHHPQDDATVTRVEDEHDRRLLDRYVQAWENADLDAFVALLREDAIFSMPPRPEWYRGRAAIRTLLRWAWNEIDYRAFRLVALRANRQPAFALYGRNDEDASWHAHAIHVLTLRNGEIAVLSQFMDESLFATFGIALTL